METKYIREFLTLAERGNSTAAAETLFLSKSTLIRHIEALEEEFGVPLFERTRSGFVLNAHGQTFLPFAQKMALLQTQCERALHNVERDPNTVRLCTQCKVIDLVIDFKRKFPQFQVEYRKMADIEKGLQSGSIDIAFLSALPDASEPVTLIPFCREEVLVLLYEGHPLAKRPFLRLEELRQERFVYLCDDPIFEDTFARVFGRIGFSQDIAATVPVGTDLIEMVQAKIGITLIHGKAETTPNPPGLRAIPLDPRLEYDVNLCYRNDVPLLAAAREFVSFTRSWILTHKELNLTMLPDV